MEMLVFLLIISFMVGVYITSLVYWFVIVPIHLQVAKKLGLIYNPKTNTYSKRIN